MNESQKHMMRRIGMAVLLIAAIALGSYIGTRAGDDEADAPAAAQNESQVHRDIAGRVERLAPEQGVMTVDHEEIEGFMSAMVMDLQVADVSELQRLEPGDDILFDLAYIDGTYTAVNIRPADADDTEPAPHPDVENPLGRGDLIPNLTLFNTRGERMELHDIQPRHKLITFFYARCPLDDFCPAQSRRLAELQEKIEASGGGVHLVSLTLDAEHDGPDVLAGYEQRFNVDAAHWTLAGGEDPQAVRNFARRAGARVYEHEDSFEIDHALVALRVDGQRIVDVVYGLDAIQQLVEGMLP